MISIHNFLEYICYYNNIKDNDDEELFPSEYLTGCLQLFGFIPTSE